MLIETIILSQILKPCPYNFIFDKIKSFNISAWQDMKSNLDYIYKIPILELLYVLSYEQGFFDFCTQIKKRIEFISIQLDLHEKASFYKREVDKILKDKSKYLKMFSKKNKELYK